MPARFDALMMRRLLASLRIVLALAVALSASAAADAPSPWSRHDPGSTRTIDHGLWEQFLMRYVRVGEGEVNLVAYGSVTPDDRHLLDRYVAKLAELPIATYNRDEQMAFWINLYNALLVRLVIDHYPVDSILDIEARPGRHDPWNLKLVEIQGHDLSLDDIEDGILGAIWEDLRVYYALSCGALGCPDLQPVPYTGRRLEEELTDAAMGYVNDRRCVKLEDDRLIVSSIYRWHRGDFGGSDDGVISHLMAFAGPDLAMRLQHFDRISGDAFDWRLNDAPAR
jgi:hypothetical protein